MSQPKPMIFANDRDPLIKEYRGQLQRKYKCIQHTHFLSECINENLLPNFTRITKKVKQTLNLSAKAIRNQRRKTLENALHSQNNYYFLIINRITAIFSKLGNFMTCNELKVQTSIFNNQIEKAQFYNDQIRENKLEKLRNLYSKNKNFQNFQKVKIHNFSNKHIPADILDFLSLGLQTGIGGIPNRNLILSKFESFFSDWQKHAVIEGLNLIQITEIKSFYFLNF